MPPLARAISMAGRIFYNPRSGSLAVSQPEWGDSTTPALPAANIPNRFAPVTDNWQGEA
jgi:hypothetical protein